MRFQAATALAILAYVSNVTATPVAAAAGSEELVPIGTDIVDGLELTWYGIPEHQANANATAANENAKRACGDNFVVCSGSHKASNSVCQSLLSALNNNRQTTVSRSPRAVCQGQSNNQCCTSWSIEVNGNLQYGHLYDAASKVISQCNSGGSISGLARDVDLAGTCTTQCVSNRANGCS